MALTASAFLMLRPEFAAAGPSMVNATMLDAAKRVSAVEYGSSYDNALALMTAHLLWESPFGASMRLEGGGEATESRYLKEFRALTRESVPRMGVL